MPSLTLKRGGSAKKQVCQTAGCTHKGALEDDGRKGKEAAGG